MNNIEEIYPLAPLQGGLLFHSLYEPTSGVYVDQLSCRLEGALDTEAFKRAWEHVVARHAILRTAFLWEGLDTPLQVVRRSVEIPIEQQDWRGMTQDEQETRLEHYLQAELARGFDVTHAPLLRLSLFQLADEIYQWIWSNHHAVLDGWSRAYILKEVFAYYEAERCGKALLLAQPRPYRDYIAWLEQQDLTQAERFWREELRGIIAPTPLGMDHGESQAQTSVSDSASEMVLLSEATTGALQRLAGQEYLTLSTLLQGAWALLLGYYSAQEEVLFGLTVSGRPAELQGVEQMVGLFINTLPLRVRMDPQVGVMQWLRGVQDRVLEVQNYAYAPLVQIQGWSQVPRGTPLFESIVVFENYPVDTTTSMGFAGLQAQQTHAFDLTNYPLTVVIGTGRQLHIRISYGRERFESETIKRLLEHLRTLLESMVAHPEQRIGELPLLTQEEQRLLSEQVYATEPFLLEPPSLSQRFEKQVGRSPEAVALVYEEQQVTYEELDRRANQLAHALRTLGVGPEVRVGLCLPRSVTMLIGLLAILKAGGAYVPLDPDAPGERLAFLIQDSQLALVLGQARFASELPLLAPLLVSLDSWEFLAHEPASPLPCEPHPAQSAYVIYTSGSTGTPKGVLVAHGNVLRLFESSRSHFGFHEHDVWTLAHSITFDFSVWEVWGALLFGGRLVLVPSLVSRAPEDLFRLLSVQGVSVLNQTPSAFQHLAQVAAQKEERLALRYVIFGGEALDVQILDPWWQKYGAQSPQLVNMYGITETTVHVTYQVIEEMAQPSGRGSRIGGPLSDLQVYVVDPWLRVVPVGVPGEVYIGGAGLARGYLNRAELTAERFVPDPFRQEPGARLYRSGDRARWLADGTLEYLGRLDDQVKVRGFRIELGEVEVVLGRHPEVEAVVVMVREEVVGEKRLVAYLVPHSGRPAPTVASLRTYGQQQLPEYMIPSTFVVLEELPLTPNGKVDRRALPAPQGQRPTLESGYVAASTPTQELLVGIWQQVLRLEQVGIHDNFFALGGDSILSIQIVSRARQAGAYITARQLFQQPSIAQLVTVVQVESTTDHASQDLVQGEVPLTPIQYWFFEQRLPVPHHFNQALLLQTRRRLQASWLEQAIRALLWQHDALRLRFTPTATGWQQAYVGMQAFPERLLVRVDLAHLPSGQQREAVEEMVQQMQEGLHVQHGPLFRIALFDLGPMQPQRVALVVHHLVIDGVSWRIVLEDLQRAYEQRSAQQEVVLAAKTSSYQQWAQYLQTYVQHPQIQQQQGYWRRQRERAIEQGLVPDRWQEGQSWAEARTLRCALSEPQTRALLQEVPRVYRTQITEVLVAALVMAWANWTGQAGVWVELEGHGREEQEEAGVDLTRTVGWFTTLYPVLIELGPSREPGAVLKQVKEQMRQIPQHGLGYGVLRYLGANPGQEYGQEPAISFNYLGQFDQIWSETALWEPTAESSGSAVNKQGQRPHELDISAQVVQERLWVQWGYGPHQPSQKDVEELAEIYLEQLQAIIVHCQSAGAGGYTPSDFPLAAVDQRTLDSVLGNGRQVEDLYPLSPMQQGLLFHSLYEPTSGVYIEQLSCRMSGILNESAFKHAWQQVVARHAIFRTSFHLTEQGLPLQMVHREVTLPWEMWDWSDLVEEEQQALWDRFLKEDRQRGCELTRAPLLRLHLFQLTERTYQWVLTYHHILLDGWSMSAVLKEVFAYYEAERLGQTLVLPQPRSYRDYIGWLEQQDLMQAERFWREELRGIAVPTSLRIDQGMMGQETRTGEPASETLFLSDLTTLALQELVHKYQLTLSTLVQGMWALLLSYYSGEQDVLFGMVVSGRPSTLAGVELMVGPFINTLPVHVRIAPELSLVQWLQRIQEQLTEVRQYEYSPLVQVQEWSEISQGMPLFESIVAFENYLVDTALQEQSGENRIEDVRAIGQTNYPLMLVAVPGRQMRLQLNYIEERFSSPTIMRMLGHLQTLLENARAMPEQYLSQLPLLTRAEQEQQLFTWNAAVNPSQSDCCIHQLFNDQAARTPDRVALIDGSRQVTYQELNIQANQLAHYLQKVGVQQEMRIGICLQHSIEQIIGLLGALKAGGTCVPLDPNYPWSRLEYIIEDSSVHVLLTQEAMLDRLPIHIAERICLDTHWSTINQQSGELKEGADKIESLAYIIYTSGSTGRPKGVAISHGSVLNRLSWMWQSCPFKENEKSCIKTTLSFVDAIWEVFGPLLSGVTNILFVDEVSKDPLELVTNLERYQITRLLLVPSLLHALLDLYPDSLSRRLSSLSLWVSSGEALLESLARRFHEQLSPRKLMNLYGMSEAWDTSASILVDSRFDKEEPVFIGHPIANMQMYVLNQHLQLVPTGIPGELYVGGAGLARGYLDQPGLTAERFIPHPFSLKPGMRLYRTGDLARYRPDGNLEYLGRVDYQVKIRGVRIELGEIESLLNQHLAVRKVVIVARERVSGEKQLVAYIVLNTDHLPPTGEEWRTYLQSRLPEYMIPTSFVVLEDLPLTPNGKLDRLALPELETSYESLATPYVPPQKPIQEVLAGIWRHVLKCDQVGLYDNFFSLGGHSLLATQVLARLRSALHVEVSLRTFFEETPTIAALSEHIEAALRARQNLAYADVPIETLDSQARGTMLPLSFAQQRLWFLDQWKQGSPLYNIPLAIRLGGPIHVAALLTSLRTIMQRHEVLRASFLTLDGQPVQVLAPHSQLNLSLIDLVTLAERVREEVALYLIGQEAQLPFNLSEGPLLRVRLLRVAAQEHIFLLTLHHIVADGWSVGILVDELSILYTAAIAGQRAQLPELPIQYPDYTLWQRQWLQGEMLENQISYWRKRLAGVTVLALPTDYPRPSVQSFHGAVQSFLLPGALRDALHQLSQQEEVTLFMTLLAVFQVLLARYSGQEDIIVGTSIANRPRPELEKLIGYFANMLVLRTDLSGNPTFRELLNRVRGICLEAYAYQDLPFERLVEELQLERDLSRAPLVQATLVLQNTPVSSTTLGQLRLQPIEGEVEHSTSKFELTVTLVEGSNSLQGIVEYNTDLFEPETITRMLGHLRTLLEAVVVHPEQRIGELPLLTQEERVHLLEQWSAIRRPLPKQQSITQLFEEQVARSSEAVALVYEEQQITYEELNGRANQLAHYLRELGVGPEVRVGLCLSRSVELLIGLLAILKAGGAYVPLDPNYPQERLTFMLEDAAVPLLVTRRSLLTSLDASDTSLVCLDADWEKITRHASTNPCQSMYASFAAYVIYTSGSTGKPKGVAVEHRQLLHSTLVRFSYYQVPVSRYLLLSSFAFDSSVAGLFWTLCQGGTLVLPVQGLERAPSDVVTLLSRMAISHLLCLPSLYLLLLAQAVPDQLQSLNTVIVAGEACPRELISLHHEMASQVFLSNEYGPTEATVWSTAYQLDPSSSSLYPGQPVSIGQPISNVQIYLLGPQEQVVPVGITGEIYIGGAGLARGYLNRSELTAERFVPNPFSGEHGARLYRTGDLARFLPDGNLEYLGRTDDQVKIRGFRIELGEIEAVLRTHPTVREAVVVAREDVPGDKRLIAYLVLVSEQPMLTTNAWQQYLQQQLPDYMIPAVFIVLDALPFTSNGKVDRYGLPVPDLTRPFLENACVPPQTPTQKILATVWQQVLQIEQVGIHDNFFALGGHSLLATQVLARVRSAFGVELAVHLLFEATTIAELAEIVDESKGAGVGHDDQILMPVSREAYRIKRSSLEGDGR